MDEIAKVLQTLWIVIALEREGCTHFWNNVRFFINDFEVYSMFTSMSIDISSFIGLKKIDFALLRLNQIENPSYNAGNFCLVYKGSES